MVAFCEVCVCVCVTIYHSYLSAICYRGRFLFFRKLLKEQQEEGEGLALTAGRVQTIAGQVTSLTMNSDVRRTLDRVDQGSISWPPRNKLTLINKILQPALPNRIISKSG